MIEPRQFRNTLSRFASGVTVVSMQEGGSDYGITVSAFMSVSLDPPLVAVCIDKGAKAHETLMRGDRFGVSVLAQGQEAVSDHFAGRPSALLDPFTRHHGFPFVDGALAWLLCSVHARHDAGDHTIFVGRVERLGYADSGAPLLYFRSGYAQLRELDLVE